MASGAKADRRFNNEAFIYDAAKNEHICQAGEALIWRYSYVETGLKLHRYWKLDWQPYLSLSSQQAFLYSVARAKCMIIKLP